MSAQSQYDAFIPVERDFKTRVMGMTWGHLAPKKNKKYYGSILFTLSNYGDNTIINSEFNALPDSPWFYTAMDDFIYEQKLDRGGVYKFIGTFRNYVFAGKILKINTKEGSHVQNV